MQAQKIETRSFEEFIDVEQDDLSVAKASDCWFLANYDLRFIDRTKN